MTEHDSLMDQVERNYYEATLRLLEESYVAADERGDAAAGSGSTGGLTAWEAKRRVIATAFDRDGTWLDVGCANGLLMQTLTAWTAAAGVSVEPYGLELSERIADRARLRYPKWSDRIWTGNVMTWQPLNRFDYVTVLPEHVPSERFAGMLSRILEIFLTPRGKLVVNCYFPRSGAMPPFDGRPKGAPPLLPARMLLRRFGFTAFGEAQARREDGSLWTSVAWLDRG